MKKKNSKSDYIEARNRDLKAKFLERLGRPEFPKIESIFPTLADVKADRFYISEERALLYMKYFHREGSWPAGMKPLRRRMMEVIRRRVEILQAFRPTLSLSDAVYEVVNSEAPSFYLTPRSIRTILYETC